MQILSVFENIYFTLLLKKDLKRLKKCENMDSVVGLTMEDKNMDRRAK